MASGSKDVVYIIGIVCIVIVAFYILKFILSVLYNNFLSVALRINAIDSAKTGKWAVVTGATDGIGKEFAKELAKKGLNLVLISRTQAKLDEVASSLESQYKVETKTIAADFTKPDDIYYNIEKQLQNLDIGVLINNVGLFYPYPEYFLDVKDKDQLFDDIVKCNILSANHMCTIVLPGMVARKRGVIVNIASILGIVPGPLITVYAASHAYIIKFSEDLHTEYKNHGVTIQCLTPGLLATKLSKAASSWSAPTASEYVKSALPTIGVRDRNTGYFPHTMLLGVTKFMDSISVNLSRSVMMKSMKARADTLNKAVQE